MEAGAAGAVCAACMRGICTGAARATSGSHSQPGLSPSMTHTQKRQAAAEAKRIDELRKQKALEREKEEFEAMAAGASGKQ